MYLECTDDQRDAAEKLAETIIPRDLRDGTGGVSGGIRWTSDVSTGLSRGLGADETAHARVGMGRACVKQGIL